MKKWLHVFILFILIACSSILYAQETPEKLSIQFQVGDNVYINPQTKLNGVAPSIELNLLRTLSSDVPYKTGTFFLIGLNYNYAEQSYLVALSPKKNVTYHASINETLLNIGGMIKKVMNGDFLNISMYAQYGPTYAKTNEPYASIAGIALTSVHEFYQFYLTGGAQYEFVISNKVSFLLGAKARFYVFANDVGDLGMNGNNIRYNYAPIKINATAGIQIKLGK